jgi:hypothetical protein
MTVREEKYILFMGVHVKGLRIMPHDLKVECGEKVRTS